MDRVYMLLVVFSCLVSGVTGGQICDDTYSYCSFGCCSDYTYGFKREICCEHDVFESYNNIPVIVGATIGGVILLVVIVSVIVCVVCCMKKNRAQNGHVMAGQPAVYAGAYPMQTMNMQPGVNQWQQQSSTNMQHGFNQWQQIPSSNMQQGGNQWQPPQPPPYEPTASHNNKWQQPPAFQH
ncbi:hypothetical protein DPMN_191200 [Dreissena polymorpha]|uniref:Uncharacterized protein n=2 Tax=Dreissena polymorpha TaxID=45954 RepID=A0A9D3Y2T9_DREPO|nr:hypothetical protein DPMN_191200 [Dreissena polymorpha]